MQPIAHESATVPIIVTMSIVDWVRSNANTTEKARSQSVCQMLNSSNSMSSNKPFNPSLPKLDNLSFVFVPFSFQPPLPRPGLKVVPAETSGSTPTGAPLACKRRRSTKTECKAWKLACGRLVWLKEPLVKARRSVPGQCFHFPSHCNS